MQRRYLLYLGWLSGWSAALAPTSASPATLSDTALFESADVVDDAMLGSQRGGFVFDGLEISLGAQIQTFINGDLALMTTVTWTDTTSVTQQIVSGTLTPASATQLQAGLLQSRNITMNVGTSSVFMANDGQTALIQRADSGIQNMLVNTANNTSIRTQVDAVIDVSGYSAFQANLNAGNLANSLGIAVDAATLGIVTN